MRKRGFEVINLKKVSIIALCVFFLTISVGYSTLKQKMNIYGKATIVEQRINGYLKGNSVYSYEILSSEKNQVDNHIVYKIKLIITNRDSDLNSWNVCFDVPNGYIDEMSKITTNVFKEYKNGRLCLKSNSNNGYVSKGGNLEIEMELAFSETVSFGIDNLTLNDKLAENIKH